MGGSESVQQGNETPTIRSSSSYFGQNTDIGEINTNNLEETIRDLQLERLYKRNPNLRPKPQSDQPGMPQSELQFLTVLSVSDPLPFLKKYDNFNLISFGFKSQTPGRIALISNNVISSLTFDACERTSISIPLPFKSEDFIIDITPDLEKYGKPIPRRYTPILKHELIFKFVDDVQNKLSYVANRLFTKTDNLKIDVNKNVVAFDEQLNGNCLICSKNVADTQIGDNCGHCTICKECLQQRQIRIHHCPICGAPSVI